jgi:dephospho-CoA kinase
VSPALRVGLTGGIGSGKSTVAKLFLSCGARIIDADVISRKLTAAGGVAIPLIAKTFGPTFANKNGELNRDKMRHLIYSDSTARAKLEAIIHPMVAHEIKFQTNLAIEDQCKVVVFDIPLLVESAVWRMRVDHVLVIDSTSELQIQRVMARSGMTRSEIEKIVASQTTRHRRLRAADSVISNIALSLSQLANEVHYIASRFGLSCN